MPYLDTVEVTDSSSVGPTIVLNSSNKLETPPRLGPSRSGLGIVPCFRLMKQLTRRCHDRDGLLLKQMPPEDGDLFFRRVVFPLLLHAFSHLPYRENAFSISN